jgi:ABC-type uncharacterized transport system ATPase component
MKINKKYFLSKINLFKGFKRVLGKIFLKILKRKFKIIINNRGAIKGTLFKF